MKIYKGTFRGIIASMGFEYAECFPGEVWHCADGYLQECCVNFGPAAICKTGELSVFDATAELIEFREFWQWVESTTGEREIAAYYTAMHAAKDEGPRHETR